jgi:flagellar protein FliL
MSEAEKSGGANKMKLIIIALAVLAVLGIGGAIAAVVLLKQPAAEAPADEAADEHAEDSKPEKKKKKKKKSEDEEHAGPPVFEQLEPLVVNLSGESASVMRVAISAKLDEEKTKEMIGQYRPKIQGELLLLFSSKTAEELLTHEGKLKLIEETKLTINRVLESEEPSEGPVEDVAFTDFIIQ